MASLAGSTPASTFRSLLKTSDNAVVGASLIQVTDGLGNGIPMAVSTAAVSMSNAVITGSLSGNATTATTAANVLGGVQYYVPFFNTNTALSSSFLYQSASIFKTTYNGSDIGLKLDFLNEQYTLGRDSTEFLRVQTELIYTNYGGNDVGLKLDFANSIYKLGDYNGIVGTSYVTVDSNNSEVNVIANNYTNLLATGNNVKIGDSNESNNGTMIEIGDSNKIIRTQFNSDQIGLNLDFENNLYELGKTNTGGVAVGLDVSNNTDYIDIGDYNNTNTGIGILVDVTNNLIKTYTSNPIAGTEKGLKLDFANYEFYLGDFNGNNEYTYIYVDDNARTINLNAQGTKFFQGSNTLIKLGDVLSSANGTLITIDDLAELVTISRPTKIEGSTTITGSVTIKDILALVPRTTTPASPVSGSIIVSGSGASIAPYFWNGSAWVSMI